MTEIDQAIEFFTAGFWILSVLLLYLLASSRLKKKTADKWNYQNDIDVRFPRLAVMTLMKMYSTVKRSTPQELALKVRNELTTDIALAYDKPISYFIRIRREPKTLSMYIDDDELVKFFYNPKRWANESGGLQYKVFGLFKQANITPQYLDNLENLIERFERSISSLKITSEV